MRFAISLLSVLAIASIVGTVLKQGDPYPNYVNQFGPFWADVFRSLGLYTVYSSWWFLLILFFLMASTTLCIVRNAPKMVADIRSWRDHVREGSLRAFGHKAEFSGPTSRALCIFSTMLSAFQKVNRFMPAATTSAMMAPPVPPSM